MHYLRPFILLLFVVVSLPGCSNVEPWVKPYERANLSDPIMSFSRDPITKTFAGHVYSAREAARGAEGGHGGGCGCN